MLNEAAKQFINHPRAVTLDDNGRLTLSSIYKWFKEDFGTDLAQVLAHIQTHASDELSRKITAQGKVKVKYKYDWGLNDAGKAR